VSASLTEHWTSAGWRTEVERWIHATLAALGRRVTGPVEQPRVRFWSTQLKVPTDDGLVWFKENCPSLRAEAAVVAVLARLTPGHVVAPLAVEPDRGWLLSPDRGATLASLDSTDEATWKLVLTEYADLQRRTVDAAEPLRDAGLPSLLPADAPDHLDRLAAEFQRLPESSPLHIDARQATGLRSAAEALRSPAAELDRGPVPAAFEHNDLHHNNAFVPGPGEETLRFFDFGDALWAHPFTSLAIPLNVMTQEWGTTEDDPRVQRLVDAYLARWTDLADLHELRRLLHLALPFSRVHRLETWRRVLTDATPAEAAEWAEPPRTWIATIIEHANRH
jgi:hypothetical protein